MKNIIDFAKSTRKVLFGRVPKGIRIYRVEFWIGTGPADFGKLWGACGCHIFSLGKVGFTWLSKECMYNGENDGES